VLRGPVSEFPHRTTGRAKLKLLRRRGGRAGKGASQDREKVPSDHLQSFSKGSDRQPVFLIQGRGKKTKKKLKGGRPRWVRPGSVLIGRKIGYPLRLL